MHYTIAELEVFNLTKIAIYAKINANYSKYQFPHGYCDLFGLNELITEHLSFEVTKCQECTTYQQYLEILSEIRNRLGEEGFDTLIQAYFRSDIRSIWNMLYKIYGLNMLQAMNRLTNAVRGISNN